MTGIFEALFVIIFYLSFLIPFINLILLFLWFRKEKKFINLAYAVTILSFTYLAFAPSLGFLSNIILFPLFPFISLTVYVLVVLVAILSLYPLIRD